MGTLAVFYRSCKNKDAVSRGLPERAPSVYPPMSENPDMGHPVFEMVEESSLASFVHCPKVPWTDLRIG